MIDKLLKVDSTKDNLVDQIQDLQERISELERFALTSQDIKANKIAVGLESVLGDIVDGDLATMPWTDYGSISTINGWTTFTVQQILYKKIGNLVFVNFFIEGVSDDTVVNFTLPYTTIGTCNVGIIIRRMDDSTIAVGLATLAGSSNVVNCYPAVTGGSWTNSGNKKVYGQFFYEIA